MVVFIDGKPEKREYRKYKIKTVQGPDDYESMREVVRRRYSRVLKEELPLPDLIIIDGGKGHVEAVRDVLENELGLDIPLSGLVKDEKHRTSQLMMGNPLEIVPLDVEAKNFIYYKEFKMKYIVLRLPFIVNYVGKMRFNRSLMIFQVSGRSEGSNCLSISVHLKK